MSTQSSATPSGIRKYAYIDALRGVAILMVIVGHVGLNSAFAYPEALRMVVGEGARGVQLFYLLSALTLCLSMASRTTKERFPILNFFIRRFFRIAPLFYVAILYYLWQDGLGPRYGLGDAAGVSLSNIIATFTFINGVSPYWINSIVNGGWSIAVEMTFYLILPFLFFRIKSLASALGLLILSIFLVDGFTFYLLNHPFIHDVRLWSDYLFFYFPYQYPVFLMGIVAYFLVQKKEAALVNPRLLSVALLGLGALIALNYLTGGDRVIAVHWWFAGAFLALTYALSLVPWRLLVNSVTTFVGKISFSLYLVHLGVLHNLDKLSWFQNSGGLITNWTLRLSLTLVISIAVSLITYYAIEVPGQQLGKYLVSLVESHFSWDAWRLQWSKNKAEIAPLP